MRSDAITFALIVLLEDAQRRYYEEHRDPDRSGFDSHNDGVQGDAERIFGPAIRALRGVGQ